MPKPAALMLTLLLLGGLLAGIASAADDGAALREVYTLEVDTRLQLPDDEAAGYADALKQALADAGLDNLPPQYFVLVDRDVRVQTVMVWWKVASGRYELIGASPVSTGRPDAYDHFKTPVGVFDHWLANPDFRAEGTRNDNGILGYGRKGMRVYDFGWQQAERGWGPAGESSMRLQMHSTDPDMLEPRIGTPQSKGCVRIPASLNTFIDRHGILDADYLRAAAMGIAVPALRADREPTAWPGRYLVVIDSQRAARPPWAPLPRHRSR